MSEWYYGIIRAGDKEYILAEIYPGLLGSDYLYAEVDLTGHSSEEIKDTLYDILTDIRKHPVLEPPKHGPDEQRIQDIIYEAQSGNLKSLTEEVWEEIFGKDPTGQDKSSDESNLGGSDPGDKTPGEDS